MLQMMSLKKIKKFFDIIIKIQKSHVDEDKIVMDSNRN